MKYTFIISLIIVASSAFSPCIAGDESSDTMDYAADERCIPVNPGSPPDKYGDTYICRNKLVSMDGYDSGERRQYGFAIVAPDGYQPCGFTVPTNEPTPAGWASTHADQQENQFYVDLTAAGKDSKVFFRIISRFVKGNSGRYKDNNVYEFHCGSKPFSKLPYGKGSGHFQNGIPQPNISCIDIPGLGRSKMCTYPGLSTAKDIYCGSC